MTFADQLVSLDACGEAREWVGARDLATAWSECRRGDWMLWLAARAGVDRRVVVLACCDVAEPALVHVPADEDRPRLAIETARAWCRGEATIEQVRNSAFAAADAAADAAAYAADAASAASAAVYADAAFAASAASAAVYADAAFAAAAASRFVGHPAVCAALRARITSDMVAAAIGRTP